MINNISFKATVSCKLKDKEPAIFAKEQVEKGYAFYIEKLLDDLRSKPDEDTYTVTFDTKENAGKSDLYILIKYKHNILGESDITNDVTSGRILTAQNLAKYYEKVMIEINKIIDDTKFKINNLQAGQRLLKDIEESK